MTKIHTWDNFTQLIITSVYLLEWIRLSNPAPKYIHISHKILPEFNSLAAASTTMLPEFISPPTYLMKSKMISTSFVHFVKCGSLDVFSRISRTITSNPKVTLKRRIIPLFVNGDRLCDRPVLALQKNTMKRCAMFTKI